MILTTCLTEVSTPVGWWALVPLRAACLVDAVLADRIGAGTSVDDAVGDAVGGGDRVVAGVALEGVDAAVAEEGVVAVVAGEVVVAAAADQGVVAEAAGHGQGG